MGRRKLKFSERHLRNMEVLYDVGLSTLQIGEFYGCLGGSIHRRLVARGVQMRTPNESKRKRDTRYITSHGYVRLTGKRYEHRVVAEKKIGRELREGEHVHHKNGDKKDNRPENLEVVSPERHREIHDRQRPDRWTEADKARLIDMRKMGKTAREIAVALGRTDRSITSMTNLLIQDGRIEPLEHPYANKTKRRRGTWS